MSKEIDLAELKAPFAPDEIEWRVQRAGKKDGGNAIGWALVLAYITNRAIMDRLDAVCGPENWKNEYQSAPGGGTLCGLSIRIDGEWITKFDGADRTDIEATKGGLSNAMKRAGSQWGIGRYLYDLDEAFVDVTAKGGKGDKRIDDKKAGVKGFWSPPRLPEWAMPGKAKTEPQPQRESQPVRESVPREEQPRPQERKADVPTGQAPPKTNGVSADPHWSKLAKGVQIDLGKRFKDLADAVEWGPDYEDVYHWAESKKILEFDAAKERASISNSTRKQIDYCLEMLAKLARARPARARQPKTANPHLREVKSLLDGVKARDKKLHAILADRDAKITFEAEHLCIEFPAGFTWQMDKTLEAQALLEELTGLQLRITALTQTGAN